MPLLPQPILLNSFIIDANDVEEALQLFQINPGDCLERIIHWSVLIKASEYSTGQLLTICTQFFLLFWLTIPSFRISIEISQENKKDHKCEHFGPSYLRILIWTIQRARNGSSVVLRYSRQLLTVVVEFENIEQMLVITRDYGKNWSTVLFWPGI